jgi:VanZ family protein
MRIEPIRNRVRWVFALALVVVAVLALMPPRVPMPDTGWDKLNHALAFTVLCILGIVSYPRHTTLVLAGLLVYGGAIELLQGLTGYRTAEWLDWGADGAGLAVGSLLARLPASGLFNS